jgi:hypothetical protein
MAGAACDKAQLTAPTNSTVSITTASSFVPTGGTTEVTAFVAESSGTPVQNGTVVRFSTNLGRVEPVDAQTRGGYAVATFVAGDASGVADVRATSGAIGGTTSTTPGATASNIVQITVGAAAVETVVLGANPGSVPVGGGTVNLLATVVRADGGALPGVTVTFTASAGQLADTVVTTDTSGQARTTLSTDRQTTATAQAGTKTSNTVTVTANANVVPTLTAAGDAVVVGVGQRWTFTATLTPANEPSAQPTQFDWSFGDGANATTNSNSTSYVYSSPASSPNTVRTVSVSIRLTNGQTVVASTQILLGAF